MNDGILKQESESRVEQERMRTEQQQIQIIKAKIGHNEAISPKAPASRAVN